MVDTRWVTADQITADLTAAGLPKGGIVMVHASLSAFGWIVGGVDATMHALLKAVGQDGTVCAYAGWEDNPYHLDSWPPDRQDAYRSGMPAFNPAISEARRRYGRLPERIRTWPGAFRSVHPEMNMVAVGPRAEWLTASNLDDDPWNHGSPLARVAESDGTVLLLGAPIDSITLIHHAERIAAPEPKRWVTYQMPIFDGGASIWRTFRAIDTAHGAYDYQALTGQNNYLAAIAQSALNQGVGRAMAIRGVTCHMFSARHLVHHARTWIEHHCEV